MDDWEDYAWRDWKNRFEEAQNAKKTLRKSKLVAIREEIDEFIGRGKIITTKQSFSKKFRNKYGLVLLEKTGLRKENCKYYITLEVAEKIGVKELLGFKKIYKKKTEIFRFLIKQDLDIEVSDYYVQAFFVKWESDFHKAKVVESPLELTPGRKYDCLVISEGIRGYQYIGWIKEFPLLPIHIYYSDRDDLDEPYLLMENEVINTELHTQSSESEIYTGIYAKNWNNDNLHFEEPALPTYLDEKMDVDRNQNSICIVEKKGEGESEYEIDVKKIVQHVFHNVAADKWFFSRDGKEMHKDQGRSVQRKSLTQSHDFLLESAEYKNLKIVFKEEDGKVKMEESLKKSVALCMERLQKLEETGGDEEEKKEEKDWIKYYEGEWQFSDWIDQEGVLENLLTSELLLSLIKSIYIISSKNIQIQLKDSPRWTIFCDERFVRTSEIAIMYSIIPPGANDCPHTSAFYHGNNADYYIEKETRLLQKSLSENQEILNFSFLIDLEKKNSDLPSETVAQGISCTFPIVSQMIQDIYKSYRTHNGNEFKVSFVNERINVGEYDTGVNIVLETSDKLVRVMEGFKKVEPFEGLAKRPNSHPFLQYPDLIGRKYDCGNGAAAQTDYINSIKEFKGTMKTFEEIKGIILNQSSPINFLKELIESENTGLSEYCIDKSKPKYYEKILAEKIRKNIQFLYDNEDLKTLFEFIKQKSEKVSSRRVIGNILAEIYSKSEIRDDYLPEYYCTPSGEFEWLMQRLDYEKREDNVKEINELRKALEIRKKDERLVDVYPNRLQNMENLFISCDQNYFVFDLEDKSEIERIIRADNTTQEEDSKVGAMCLSLLLKENSSNSDDFRLAEKGEKYLLNKIIDRNHDPSLSRRYTNLLEIGIIKSVTETGASTELIGYGTLRDIYQNREIYGSFYSKSSFFMAVVLKTIALTDFSKKGGDDLAKFARQVLDAHCFMNYSEHYPNNRVAYWFIRAYFNLNEHSTIVGEGNQIDHRIDKCSELLFKMKNNQKKKNAIGLMVICELLDLYYRFGFKDGKHLFEGFEHTDEKLLWDEYNVILSDKNTASSTRKWFEVNKPDENDRLKPLNFNYR